LPLPPVAVHEVALIAAQVNVVDWPTWMVVGTATNAVIVGSGRTPPEVTVTVTELGVLAPPGPVQVRL
jgi:hypothetical protein